MLWAPALGTSRLGKAEKASSAEARSLAPGRGLCSVALAHGRSIATSTSLTRMAPAQLFILCTDLPRNSLVHFQFSFEHWTERCSEQNSSVVPDDGPATTATLLSS